MRKLCRQILAALLLSAALSACSCSVIAKSYDVGAEESSEYTDAKILDHPDPQIPPSLREECLKLYCLARFAIDETGKARVKLLTSSGSNEIDDITLSTLRRWKFSPAMLDGKPVASTRRVKVEFENN